MNYPFWNIPYLGSGWVIGIIAIFHVMISQFAVGGGLYLPMAERKALRMPEGPVRDAWLKQLVNHSKFFLLITGVYGTISGVGIWFAIGLTQPEATSTLIHNFVFGWAIEWVFFLIELATAAVYYYTWDRIDPKLHLKVGWLYAGASAATLIIINGILTFMLTPGDTWLAVAGTGNEASKFWNAFFNPTYWPSLLLRVCVCASLAAVWALITSSRIDGDKDPLLKTGLVRWSAATGFLIGGGEGVGDALGRSWDATRGHSWPIFFAGLVLFVCLALGGGALGLTMGLTGSSNILVIATALVNEIGTAISAAFAIAVYVLVHDHRDGLGDVFA